MLTFTTIAEYKTAILNEINIVNDPALQQLILNLIAYAEKKETEAENRELRPRPDVPESAAYYRTMIDQYNLPGDSLENLIDGLLQLVESLESQP